MSTSSARPKNLLGYARGARDDTKALHAEGVTLSAAIQDFLKTKPDPAIISGIPDLGKSLQSYAQRKGQIDQWVNDIGNAFQKADTGGSASVTVPDSRLNQLVAEADPAVRQALAYFSAHLGDDSFFGGNQGAMDSIVDHLKDLSPEQLDEFLASLSDQQLGAWNAAIKPGSALWNSWGLDQLHQTELSNLLFSSVSPDQLGRLEKLMPNLQPSPSTSEIGGPFQWQSLSGIPLFATGPDGKPVLNPDTDINQGDIGDCWVMSGLGSIAKTDPQWIESHIHANANGTYTVTLYQDGKPVPVTVTDTVPYNAKGGWDYPYAHDLQGNDKWAMLYEKAYAQLEGGYGVLDKGGYGSVSMPAVTGQPSTRTDPGSLSIQQVASMQKSGYAFTAGTGSDTHWYEPWNHPEREDGSTLVTEHEYMIQSVDVKDGRVTLRNPWGAQGSAPPTVTLSWSDFQKYFDSVSYDKVPGAA